MASSPELTDKEAEVYDRQIRLWGVDAQKRMRASRVLVAGLGALGAEVTKNVVLAGVGVTVQDERLVTEADTGVQFFVDASHVGQNVSSGARRGGQQAVSSGRAHRAGARALTLCRRRRRHCRPPPPPPPPPPLPPAATAAAARLCHSGMPQTPPARLPARRRPPATRSAPPRRWPSCAT